MKVKVTPGRRDALMLAGALLISSVFPSFVEADGARVLERSASDIRQRGWVYTTPLSVPDGETRSATLSTLYWQLELIDSPEPPRMALCSPSRCEDLATLRGRTEAFRGFPADTRFELRYGLPGEGMLRQPVRAGRFQLILNYRDETP